MKIRLIASTLAATCLCTTLAAVAADDKPSPPPAAQAATSTVSSITQAAVRAGALACTSRINQVATFLTAGVKGVGAMLFMPTNNPDQQLISVSMEIPSTDALSVYASASFAPNQANGCGGMYETVVYWPQKCSEVAGNNFGALKKIDGFSKNFMVLDAGVTTKIFLLPAGSGCISIKKEVIQ